MNRRIFLPLLGFFFLLVVFQGAWGLYYLQKIHDSFLLSYGYGVSEGRIRDLPSYPFPLPSSHRYLGKIPSGDLYRIHDKDSPSPLLILQTPQDTYLLGPLPSSPASVSRHYFLFLLGQGVLSLLVFLFLLGVMREFRLLQRMVSLPYGVRSFGWKALSQALKLTLDDLERKKKEAEKLAEERGKALVELEQAQKQLLRNERLATLGYFSGGIVHEIGNPLSAAQQFLEVLCGELKGGDSRLLPSLEQIRGELKRIERVLTALRGLARPDRIRYLSLDLAKLLHELVIEFKNTSLRPLSLELELQEPLLVTTDPLLLQIVLRNLIQNSIKVQEQSPYVRITARTLDNEVILEIQDRGPGFPPDFHPESLFTSEHGMGFGIPLAMRIAEILRAHLRFLPHPSGGLVELTLPRTLHETGGSPVIEK